ncbi:hypothetical protein L1856_07555 [Streptomyces sp. Tue 6430]|nr:hypothetical protein [Streptomyces sp. Tue 6430]
MVRAEPVVPVRMRRVAVVAPEKALRESLVRIAEAGRVEIDVTGEGGPQAQGPAATRLRRLRTGPARPVLSEAPPDLDALERAAGPTSWRARRNWRNASAVPSGTARPPHSPAGAPRRRWTPQRPASPVPGVRCWC